MKNYIFTLFAFATISVCAQTTSRPPCCSNFIEITIEGTDLDSLHIDSVLAIAPTVAGRGIRLTKPPIIRAFHDGTPLIFASGEAVKIINEYGDISGYGNGEMSSFGDPLITPTEGIGAGSFWHSYFVPFAGQVTPSIPGTCTGNVYIWSTFPVSGGGANAKLIVSIWYEEITY